MPGKSDRFKSDLMEAMDEILQRVNFEDRTDNELDAYLNRLIEDMTHDVDRFARSGISASSHTGAIEREKRNKEERIKATIASMLSRSQFDQLDERKVMEIKNNLEFSIYNLMGKLGVQAAEEFLGETAEDMIEMIHKQDWLIQHVMVALSNYTLYDLTAGEIRELHTEIDNILKGLDA